VERFEGRKVQSGTEVVLENAGINLDALVVP
jgi:hypothetical protein